MGRHPELPEIADAIRPFPRSFALASVGNNMEAKIAMIAMTTSNSIKVNPIADRGARSWCEAPLRDLFMGRLHPPPLPMEVKHPNPRAS